MKNRAEVLGALIILRCVILALALALALVFVWILPVWKGTPLPLGVTIAALVPFFTLLAGILRTIFQVSFKMHYVFVAEVTQRIVTASLIGLLVLLGVRGSTDLDDYHHFLFIGGVGAFVLFFLSFLYGDRLEDPPAVEWRADQRPCEESGALRPRLSLHRAVPPERRDVDRPAPDRL